MVLLAPDVREEHDRPVVDGPCIHGLSAAPVGRASRAGHAADLAGPDVHATVHPAVGPVGGADRAVSGFTGGASPGGVHISRADRRSQPMGAVASWPER